MADQQVVVMHMIFLHRTVNFIVPNQYQYPDIPTTSKKKNRIHASMNNTFDSNPFAETHETIQKQKLRIMMEKINDAF